MRSSNMSEPAPVAETARLAVVTSHPVQYYSPLFAELARHVSLKVFFAHKASPQEQAAAGFGTAFDWDVDLLAGFDSVFLENRARTPGTSHFGGCDTPQLLEALREGQFDAVLVTGWHLKSYWQAVFAAKRLGIPVMARSDSQVSAQRSVLKRAVKALAYPIMLRMFDAIFYTGLRSKHYLEHYRFPPGRQHFSPHSVDVQWFASRATNEARAALRERWGIGQGNVVLLFAGKLVPFKRPLDTVRIAAALSRLGHPARVLVAGSGPLANEMSALAAAEGVDITQLGFCNQSRMPEAYAAADVLVLPSEGRETWGLVANEALACSTPVALSRDVGSAEDLSQFPGIVATFDCGDAIGAASSIDALLRRGKDPKAFVVANASYSLERAARAIASAVGS